MHAAASGLVRAVRAARDMLTLRPCNVRILSCFEHQVLVLHLLLGLGNPSCSHTRCS